MLTFVNEATGGVMDLAELEQRLVPFSRAMYEDPVAAVSDVRKTEGHAGFSYTYTVRSGGVAESWYLRLPPPNVNWRGTADVLRQVEILNALDGTDVPHCSVQWSGDDLQWFGCPYFVVPKLEGDVIKLAPGEWASKLSEEKLLDLGGQVMRALAGVHRVDWQRKTPYLGDPIPFEDDVTRWDRFYERSADMEKLADAPEVRSRLLERVPSDAPVGVFHGDFQISNLFCSMDGDLLAVIDWELVGHGATLNDVGWICTFSDRSAWASAGGGAVERPMFLDPETLVSLYEEAWGSPLPDVSWFRALAAYKFAIISGFNLSLHRRGKRPDPTWEITALSMPTLLRRALDLLG